MKMMLVLSREEVHREIPYAVICETREGSAWNTCRRRRLWNGMFTKAEKEAATRLFRMAHRWYLTTGVPEEVTMTMSTMRLWQKLGEFCSAI